MSPSRCSGAKAEENGSVDAGRDEWPEDTAELERYKHPSLGRYMRAYMTRTVKAVRLAGFALMAAGSWFHEAWLLPVGLALVILAWLRGVI